MASVLFSTIGQAIGGPLGAGVGAAVGATIDASLFRRGRQGASDLYVQRSTYGIVIPRIFGTTRVAGQLIWALPMVAGGLPKGSGRQSSATSFAIALCTGPILDVGRIWADGREIRNSEGAFEIATDMRVHCAGGLMPDPLVAAAEGLESASAFSGLSYVVLENFGLAPFGNRIPNLSFEVVADADDSEGWVGSLANAAGCSATGGGNQASATGFVAAADRLSDDLQVLSNVADAFPSLVDGRLALRGLPRVFDVSPDELVAVGIPDSSGSSRQTGDRPAGLAIDYIDPAREYQAGRQSVSRGRSGRDLGVSWPLCATADVAKALASQMLRKAETGAERLSFALSWRWLDLTIGDTVRFDEGALWRILKREVRGLVLQFEAARADVRGNAPMQAADPGRNLPAKFTPVPATMLFPFEPPVPLQEAAPQLFAIGAGGPGWRGADISVLSGGDETSIGFCAPPVPIGRLLEPLPWRSESLWDEESSLLLGIDEGVVGFETRSALEVLSGANLVKVGPELLQFRTVEFLSTSAVRLSGLLRGRFGTGYRSVPVPAGEFAVLVRPGSMPGIIVDPEFFGREVVLLASGPGDPSGGTEASHVFEGLGLTPLGPVHVRFERRDDGAILCSWIPRFREAWSWNGSADPQPPQFDWCHLSPDGVLRSVRVDGVSLTVSAAEQMARFGMLLPTGMGWVEAVGDGPAELRRSNTIRT